MGTGLDIEDILEILAALNLQFRHLLQFLLGERRIEDNVYTFTNMYKLQFCRKCNKQRIFYIDLLY